jgi:hypothetical protein
VSLVTGPDTKIIEQKDARYPSHVRERAIVESGVRHAHRLQLFLRGRLGGEDALGLVFRCPAVLRRAEELHANFLGGRGDFRLNVDGLWLDGTDDDVHAGQSLLDRVVVGIVDLDHLGVALNGGFGSLSIMSWSSVTSGTTGLLLRYSYLTGKNDNLLDGPSSLVFQELLNDEGAEVTGPDDGEVCISRHE